VSEGELLTGDGVTPGIVRIGDTVRRPLRPFSLTVQAYLAHLRDAGFTGAPLPLGIDEQGREVLSFVPGDARDAGRRLPRAAVPRPGLGQVVAAGDPAVRRRLSAAALATGAQPWRPQLLTMVGCARQAGSGLEGG
jgi:hypothetical protein